MQRLRDLNLKGWRGWRDSNPRPSVPKTAVSQVREPVSSRHSGSVGDASQVPGDTCTPRGMGYEEGA